MPENDSRARAEIGSVGFLGLGIMGSRMAANVARAGFPLAVWTHTTGKAEQWAAEHGAQAYSTPAEVAANSDVVLSMVVDGAQVRSVLLGSDGAIESARPGLLCVDMSTIGPVDTRRSEPRWANARWRCSTRLSPAPPRERKTAR